MDYLTSRFQACVVMCSVIHKLSPYYKKHCVGEAMKYDEMGKSSLSYRSMSLKAY